MSRKFPLLSNEMEILIPKKGIFSKSKFVTKHCHLFSNGELIINDHKNPFDQKVCLLLNLRGQKFSVKDKFKGKQNVIYMLIDGKKKIYMTSDLKQQNSQLVLWKRALNHVNMIEFSSDEIGSKGYTNPFVSIGEWKGYSPSAKMNIETLKVTQWDPVDVQSWIPFLDVPPSCEQDILKTFKAENIDGSVMVDMKISDLQAVFNENGVIIGDDIAEYLYKEIIKIRKKGKFDFGRHHVKKKLLKFNGFQSQEQGGEQLIDVLCDEEKLKAKYLTMTELESHVLQTLTKEDYEEQNMPVPDKLVQFSESNIKIKLVITEIFHSNSKKKFRRFAQPIISNLIPQMSQNFGFFHTAIIVGPFYLEWNDSGVVIPRKMISGSALICADVDHLKAHDQGDLQDIIDKIAKIIVKWNTLYTYKNARVSGLRENEGNCQDFVDEILLALDISPSFTGALGEFVSKLRTKGLCTLEFKPSKEFIQAYKLKKKTFIFTEHANFDQFCIKLRGTLVDGETEFSSEWSLLKSFDRAFWLRHLKFPDDPRYAPYEGTKDPFLRQKQKEINPFHSDCPFQDPRVTVSFR